MSLSSEFTTPISGKPYYESVGIIKAIDDQGAYYSVGEIAYQRFDDQNYQYVFSPYWNEIELLPLDIFDGIPGLNLDLKRDHYYRVNMTPAFIEMRTPSPSREDLWELLETVGLDYYDRFEWMLRAQKRCGDDNLIVVRKRESQIYDCGFNKIDLNDLQPDDEICLASLADIPVRNTEIAYTLFRILTSGMTVKIQNDGRVIDANDREAMIYLLKNLLSFSKQYKVNRQRMGIQQAKEEKKYRGRKKKNVDPILLEHVVKDYRQKKISESTAMQMLGIESRSTFYRRIRELDTTENPIM